MPIPYTYTYSAQLKRYIGQFLRIFSGLQVEYEVDRDKDGQKDRKQVTVIYGDFDRVVAAIVNNRNNYTAKSLPLISGYMTDIQSDPNQRKNPRYTDAVITKSAQTGSRKAVRRLMPVPYQVTMEVSLWTSNTTQMFQLVEQILVLFNPTLSFQRSNNLEDWNYITEAKFQQVTNDSSQEVGQGRRVLQRTMTFTFGANLEYPVIDSTNIIEQIEANMKDETHGIVDLETVTIDENGYNVE